MNVLFLFRVNVKHGKSFEMHVDVFFLKLRQTCSVCSLTASHCLGVMSFASFV